MTYFQSGRVRTAFLVIVLAGGAFWYFGGDNGAAKAPDAAFVTKPVDTGSVRKVVSASGSVRPLITVDIGSQLSGQIAELLVDYNDEVTEGQLLARIDPQSFQTQVTQAKAELAVANAGVDIQKASILSAKANLKEAERVYKRQKELRAQGNVAESTLDTAETGVETAKAGLAAAEAQLRNAEAGVIQRQAALAQAEINLERTEIRSSINGTVIERSVDLGQTVAASLQAPTLFQIAQDLSDIQVEASVDEADIGSVARGNRVEFTVDAFDGRTFRGVVDQVRLAPTESSNVVTYTVVISARNPGRILLPGMTANVDIITGEKNDVTRVANDALRFRPKTGAAVEGGEAAPQGEARDPRARMEAMARELGLSDDQKSRLQDRMAELRTQMQAGGGASPDAMRTSDRVQMREKMRAQFDAALKDVLTEDQWAKLQQSRSGREATRQGQVYLLAADGTLKPASVTVGLSDEDHTEVVSGLEPGAQVVVREERARR
ncbi:MAG: HlyD family efflux transporter periplasmic adaptor subunit [Alphaproteobacteria bacterium]|nr:MAG: HlyD family efflux transporter periplasmic adaptor subunit [Alphaproteobacteria bacterium]